MTIISSCFVFYSFFIHSYKRCFQMMKKRQNSRSIVQQQSSSRIIRRRQWFVFVGYCWIFIFWFLESNGQGGKFQFKKRAEKRRWQSSSLSFISTIRKPTSNHFQLWFISKKKLLNVMCVCKQCVCVCLLFRCYCYIICVCIKRRNNDDGKKIHLLVWPYLLKTMNWIECFGTHQPIGFHVSGILISV